MGSLLLETELFPTDYVESFVTPITLNSILETRRYFEPLDVFPRQKLRSGFKTVDRIFEKPVHTQKTINELRVDGIKPRDQFNPLSHVSDQFQADLSRADDAYVETVERVSSNLLCQIQLSGSNYLIIYPSGERNLLEFAIAYFDCSNPFLKVSTRLTLPFVPEHIESLETTYNATGTNYVLVRGKNAFCILGVHGKDQIRVETTFCTAVKNLSAISAISLLSSDSLCTETDASNTAAQFLLAYKSGDQFYMAIIKGNAFRSLPFYVYKDGFTIKFSWERPTNVTIAPSPDEVAAQYGEGRMPHNVFPFSDLLMFKRFYFSRTKMTSLQRGKENDISGEDFTLLLLFENAFIGLSGLSSINFDAQIAASDGSVQLRIILSSFGRELFSAAALHPIFANIAVIASTTALYVVDVRTPLTVLNRVEIALFPAHLTFQKNVRVGASAGAVDTFMTLWSFKPPGVFLFKMTIKDSDVALTDEDTQPRKNVSKRDRKAAESFISRVMSFGNACSESLSDASGTQASGVESRGKRRTTDVKREQHSGTDTFAKGRSSPTEQRRQAPQLRDTTSGVIPHVGEFFTTIFTENVEEEAFAIHPEVMRRAEINFDIVTQLYTLPERSVDDPNSSIIGFGFTCTNPRAVRSYHDFLKGTINDEVHADTARPMQERRAHTQALSEQFEESTEVSSSDSTRYDCSCYTLTGAGELWYCSTSAHFAPPPPDAPDEGTEPRPLLSTSERRRMRDGARHIEIATKRFKDVCDFVNHKTSDHSASPTTELESIQKNIRELVFTYPETLDDCRRTLFFAAAVPRAASMTKESSRQLRAAVARILELLLKESERRSGRAPQYADGAKTVCEKINATFFSPLSLHANARHEKQQEHNGDENEHDATEPTPTTLDAMFTQSQAKKELDRKAELYGWKLYSLQQKSKNWVQPYTLSKEQHVSQQLADIFAQSKSMSKEVHEFFTHPDSLAEKAFLPVEQPSDYLSYLRTDPMNMNRFCTAHPEPCHRQSSRQHTRSSATAQVSSAEASDEALDKAFSAQERMPEAHEIQHTLENPFETTTSDEWSRHSEHSKRPAMVVSSRQDTEESMSNSQVLWDNGDSVLDKDGFAPRASEGYFDALDDERSVPRREEERATVTSGETKHRLHQEGSEPLSAVAERNAADGKKRVTIADSVRVYGEPRDEAPSFPSTVKQVPTNGKRVTIAGAALRSSSESGAVRTDTVEDARKGAKRVTIVSGGALPPRAVAHTTAAGERSAAPRLSSMKPPQNGAGRASAPFARHPLPERRTAAGTRETIAVQPSSQPSSQPSEPQSQPPRPSIAQPIKTAGARPSSQSTLPVMVRKSAKVGDPKNRKAPRKSLFM